MKAKKTKPFLVELLVRMLTWTTVIAVAAYLATMMGIWTIRLFQMLFK